MSEFPRPFVTIDVVLLTLDGSELKVALLERDKEPEKGRPALIGGFLRLGEDDSLESAVSRILSDKAALRNVHFEQLRTFGSPDRDARGWSVSVSYLAAVPLDRLRQEASDLIRVIDPRDADLPFDHADILYAALDRLRSKGSYSTLPAHFLGETFSIDELRRAYEAILGQPLDQSSFRRKVADLDFLEPVCEQRRVPGVKRPTQLYRLLDPSATFSKVLSAGR